MEKAEEIEEILGKSSGKNIKKGQLAEVVRNLQKYDEGKTLRILTDWVELKYGL